jgi:hypothetical protein
LCHWYIYFITAPTLLLAVQPEIIKTPSVSPATDSLVTKTTKLRVSKQNRFTSPSLLHQKLREKNEELYEHLESSIGTAYTSASKDVLAICEKLSKSQTAIQDVSHNMRLLTNDLFHLEDKIDIVATCHILPDINICIQ